MPKKTLPPAFAGNSVTPARPDLVAGKSPPRSLDPVLAKSPKAGLPGKGGLARMGKSANRLIPASKSRGR